MKIDKLDEVYDDEGVGLMHLVYEQRRKINELIDEVNRLRRALNKIST